MFFSENITLFDLDARSDKEILSELSKLFFEKGIVKESFGKAVIEREGKYPTGLPTQPVGIAIPHTDAEHVNVPQIGFASLKEPVEFKAMGGGDSSIKVSLVFMLALKNPNDQLDVLQKLIGVFKMQVL